MIEKTMKVPRKPMTYRVVGKKVHGKNGHGKNVHGWKKGPRK